MPFGWGANPNLPAECQAVIEAHLSPMPFGWGANPNQGGILYANYWLPLVTNAFRLGG